MTDLAAIFGQDPTRYRKRFWSLPKAEKEDLLGWWHAHYSLKNPKKKGQVQRTRNRVAVEPSPVKVIPGQPVHVKGLELPAWLLDGAAIREVP